MPNVYIDHLIIFLMPLSLDTLNKSRSLLPTKAPLKLLESGAKSNDKNNMQNDIIIKIVVNVMACALI